MPAAPGIVANPMSGRDIRRLVAQASVLPNAEKADMALRHNAASPGRHRTYRGR
jgi:predicted polyphosphate/ATP-dependent NAD kinase